MHRGRHKAHGFTSDESSSRPQSLGVTRVRSDIVDVYRDRGEADAVTRSWKVRPFERSEFESWTRLFRGYCDFYHWPTSNEHQRQIWSWIHDECTVEALAAIEIDDSGREIGQPQGLAHLREWVRPLRGIKCGYLDDLFVEPTVRGHGAVDALFTEIDRLAGERGWGVVRWTTADDNYRARGIYDQVAERTHWITYDMTPTVPQEPPPR